MKRILYIFISLLLLSGCAIGPNFKKPVVPIGSTYIYTNSGPNDSIVNLAWFKLFNDPALDTLIREAVRNNKNVEMAYARVDQARYALGITRSNLWPGVGYEATGYISNADNNPNNFKIAGTINWEIDLWGKLRRMNEAAREEYLATEEGFRGVYISLISDVAATYFYLRDLDERLEISRQTLKSRQEYFDIINQRFDKGVAPEWDLRQAEVQLNIAAAAVPAFERAVSQTENTLSVLLGRNPGQIFRGKNIFDQTVNPEIPAGLPSQLLERRPDVMASMHMLAAQNAQIGVAQAMRLPSLSLTGLFGVASGELSSLFVSDAVTMSASAAILGPIFEFQRNKRRVDVERARTLEMLKSYELTVISAFADVENSLVAVKTYKDELQARENQAKAAKLVVDFSKSRYDAGVTDYLEVLDADRTNFDAQLKASETKQNLLNSHLNLYKSLGGGWTTR